MTTAANELEKPEIGPTDAAVPEDSLHSGGPKAFLSHPDDTISGRTTSFPNPGDAYLKLTSGKSDRPEDLTPEKAKESVLEAARKQFASFGDRLPAASKEFENLQANLAKFEERAKKENIPAEQMVKAYKELQRLYEHTGPAAIGPRQLMRVANQLAEILADPTKNDQGNNSTCILTDLANMIYTKRPGDIKAVVDVALSGTHITDKGLKVKIDKDSLKSFGDEAENNTFGTNKRNLATQIANLTYANLYYASERESGSPAGRISFHHGPKGHFLKYNDDPAFKNDKGEPVPRSEKQALIAKVLKDAPGEASTMKGASRIFELITGEPLGDRFIYGSPNVHRDAIGTGAKFIESGSALASHIKKLEKEGRLPAIFMGQAHYGALFADESIKSVFDEPSLLNTGHTALILGITPVNPALGLYTYRVDNTWGQDRDHHGSSAHEQVAQRGMMDALQGPPEKELLEEFREWSKKNVGKFDKNTQAIGNLMGYLGKAWNSERTDARKPISEARDAEIQTIIKELAAAYEKLPPQLQKQLAEGLAKHAPDIWKYWRHLEKK